MRMGGLHYTICGQKLGSGLFETIEMLIAPRRTILGRVRKGGAADMHRTLPEYHRTRVMPFIYSYKIYTQVEAERLQISAALWATLFDAPAVEYLNLFSKLASRSNELFQRHHFPPKSCKLKIK